MHSSVLYIAVAIVYAIFVYYPRKSSGQPLFIECFNKSHYSYRYATASESTSKFDETYSNTGDSIKENGSKNEILRLHAQPSNTSNRDYDPNR